MSFSIISLGNGRLWLCDNLDCMCLFDPAAEV